MAKKKICLDAGHYGKYNQSPAVKSYYESDMVWKLHLFLKKYLEGYGFEVITTRPNQATDLSLYNRGAKSKGCDLFLSLHSNAVGSGVNENIDYPVAYCLTDDTTTNVDDISQKIGKQLADVVAEVMETKQEGRATTRKASSDKNKDGMLNDNYYGVLNGARQVETPGIILEHSFHTNTRATNWLLIDSNLDKLAKAEAKVIANYFRVSTTTSSASTTAPTTTKELYRVRKTWADAASQIGAYSSLDNAKKACKEGYSVYDKDGKWVYASGSFKVKVVIKDLNIREKATSDSDSKGYIDPGTYTIVKTSGKWGFLKSGAGWIHLNYVERL